MHKLFPIWVAIMLRMIKTRFFGHGLGFLVSIGWPLVHILVLLILNSLADRAAPYGESLTVFFASGLVPFMTFSYMSRFIMIAVVHNRSLLSFPAVKITDLLFGAAILEVLSSSCMTIFLMLILAAFGINSLPIHPVQAASALCASFLLGFAAGIINGVIAMAFPYYVTFWAICLIVLYIISGVFFVPDALPLQLRYYASFNPTLQIVEWMRSAYYDGYGSMLDRRYTVGFGVVLLFLGLLYERLFRGRLLMTH